MDLVHLHGVDFHSYLPADGRTGFLVSTVVEMADAIAATSGLRSEHCRQAAIERFAAESMVDRYVEVYRKLAP